ncbi:hypothetical protein ABPG77_009091 [Micractinium sp. CCAP 211/92]
MAMRATCLLLMLAAAAAVLPGAAAQRRRVLTDDNFEHTTQAATGQTTGVWFVSFCSPSARACKDLAGAWEELGRELLQAQPPVFLSTVDPHASPALARRFGISTLPTLLLFRDRKMYRFEGRLTPDADTKALLRSFLEGGYMGSASQEVPPPPSPLDWLVRGAQAKLAVVQRALETKDVPALAQALLPLLLICLLAILLLLASSMSRRKTKRE